MLAEDESRWQEAEVAYRTAIELNPSYSVTYNNLGVLLAEDESRRNEAELSYNKAIEKKPDYAGAYYNLGVLLAKNESRWNETEVAYNKAIMLNPGFAEAYANLANLKARYIGEKAKDEIIENLRKCVELNPIYKQYIKVFFDNFDFIRNDPRFDEIVNSE